ncbi:hypothetical protein B0A48_08097 [Cryoendolithus antarcticus]|uniref:Uncharacterized protein n=1 Tax=Cryoendolithus antarcticus TaxID=1507870 RepID=A0A1V8T0Z4_9PEZI|nr:hypothetical protein B0A48_08097 [Cryoendolithus antarcticus]
MGIRPAFLAVIGVLSTAATLCTIAWLPSLVGIKMNDSPSIVPLEVTLVPGSTPSTLQVRIHNTDLERTISFLTWDTPLDPSAINTGVLSLVNANTGETIPGPDMKINRLLPPPRKDLVELVPGASTGRDLALKSPWIPTDGTRCTVRMQGTWRAVWAKPAVQVTDLELGSMIGDQRTTAFDTRSVEMSIDGSD